MRRRWQVDHTSVRGPELTARQVLNPLRPGPAQPAWPVDQRGKPGPFAMRATAATALFHAPSPCGLRKRVLTLLVAAQVVELIKGPHGTKVTIAFEPK